MLFAQADIIALPTENGGRQTPIFARRGSYRPHVRVRGEGEWLGVCFIDGPDQIAPGDSANVTLHLEYHPGTDYSTIEAGAQFDVVEGARIVARGKIVRIWEAASMPSNAV